MICCDGDTKKRAPFQQERLTTSSSRTESLRTKYGIKSGIPISGPRYPHSYGFYPTTGFSHGTTFAKEASQGHPSVSIADKRKKLQSICYLIVAWQSNYGTKLPSYAKRITEFRETSKRPFATGLKLPIKASSSNLSGNSFLGSYHGISGKKEIDVSSKININQ